MVTLRWLQTGEVDHWRLWLQPSGDPPLPGGWLVNTHITATINEGSVYEWTGEVADGWYTMTAVKGEEESAHSNVKYVPEPGSVVGLTACLILLAVLRRFRDT